MHFAFAFFRTFQDASTGVHANAKVKNAVMPVATQIPMTMYIRIRATLAVNMRRYCVRIEILVSVKPTQ